MENIFEALKSVVGTGFGLIIIGARNILMIVLLVYVIRFVRSLLIGWHNTSVEVVAIVFLTLMLFANPNVRAISMMAFAVLIASWLTDWLKTAIQASSSSKSLLLDFALSWLPDLVCACLVAIAWSFIFSGQLHKMFS